MMVKAGQRIAQHTAAARGDRCQGDLPKGHPAASNAGGPVSGAHIPGVVAHGRGRLKLTPMPSQDAWGRPCPGAAGATVCSRLLRRLQQMEMRAAASARPRVGPPRDDFRIGHDLIIQQQQGYIGELLEQVIANFPGQALPFWGSTVCVSFR